MKKIVYIIFIVSLMLGGVALLPSSLHAWAKGEAPWDAPVMPEGKVLSTEKTSQVIEYNQPYENVLQWYKESLKEEEKDLKYRDWKEQMYIEDQGGANWHSIGISKTGGDKTSVKITRDNMTWIMSTLLIRFAGVFIVLCILWLLLNINSFAMKKLFPEKAKKA
ncbi:MAG: hypothetical protein LBQ00_02790 [Syntrophobacterales bacterium]|nr:hypothetical protein [Syntrophobacterales bacterium]